MRLVVSGRSIPPPERSCGGWGDGVLVQYGEVLGSGASGTAYKGKYRGSEVAIKKLRVCTKDQAQSFLREVKASARLVSATAVDFPTGTFASCYTVQYLSVHRVQMQIEREPFS